MQLLMLPDDETAAIHIFDMSNHFYDNTKNEVSSPQSIRVFHFLLSHQLRKRARCFRSFRAINGIINRKNPVEDVSDATNH